MCRHFDFSLDNFDEDDGIKLAYDPLTDPIILIRALVREPKKVEKDLKKYGDKLIYPLQKIIPGEVEASDFFWIMVDRILGKQ